MTESLGALRDAPDNRDYPFRETRIAHAATELTLPSEVDWFPFLGPVKNQGTLGSCVAFACASAREFLVRTLDFHSLATYSPLYLYYRAREGMGTLGQDSGLFTRDAMKALGKWGIPDEVSWPYEVSSYNNEPPEWANTNARWKRIYSYHRLETNSLDEMRQCLAEGHAFVLSMQVWQTNLGIVPIQKGILSLPGPEDIPKGGHAVLVFGYHDNFRLLHARNSWGSRWGIAGNFFIPYEYVARYTWDAWTMVA